MFTERDKLIVALNNVFGLQAEKAETTELPKSHKLVGLVYVPGSGYHDPVLKQRIALYQERGKLVLWNHAFTTWLFRQGWHPGHVRIGNGICIICRPALNGGVELPEALPPTHPVLLTA